MSYILHKKLILPKICMSGETEKLKQILLCKITQLFFFFFLNQVLALVFVFRSLELGSYFQWEIFACCCFDILFVSSIVDTVYVLLDARVRLITTTREILEQWLRHKVNLTWKFVSSKIYSIILLFLLFFFFNISLLCFIFQWGIRKALVSN